MSKKVVAKLDEVLKELKELRAEKEKRAKYNSKYYKEHRAELQRKQAESYVRRKAAERTGLKNPDRNNLDPARDSRLGPKMVEWAELCYRFAAAKKGPYAFMRWLAYTWNCKTYWHKVITRSGGYCNLFIGFTGARQNKALRSRWSDNDLFGCVHRTKFTKVQRDQFGQALWWNWGFGVLGKVVREMQEDEERWAELPKRFTRPLLLMMGGFGEVEVRQGLKFDPNEQDCKKMGTMYSYAKPDLDGGWNACKQGLFAGTEPHDTFVNASKH